MSRNPRSVFALPLFVALLATPAAPDNAEAADTPKSTRAYVVDADGKMLGALIGPNRVLVSFPDGDAVFGLNRFGYAPLPPNQNLPDSFFYETSNCSGQPYINQNQAPGSGFFKADDPWAPNRGGNLYYATRENTVKTIRSQLKPPVVTSKTSTNSGTAGTAASLPGDPFIIPTCQATTSISTQTVVPVSVVAAPLFKAPLSIVIRPN